MVRMIRSAMFLSSLFVVFVPSFLQATPLLYGHPEPLTSEQLSPTIHLSGQCLNVKIIEWVGGPDREGIKIIDMACNIAVRNFHIQIKPKCKLSLLPWKGNQYRSLNDNVYRFKDRPKFCSIDAKVCLPGEIPNMLEGWTDYNQKIIFMRNDPTDVFGKNLNFVKVFQHELFHIMSLESGYSKQHSAAEEELLAIKFVENLIP